MIGITALMVELVRRILRRLPSMGTRRAGTSCACPDLTQRATHPGQVRLEIEQRAIAVVREALNRVDNEEIRATSLETLRQMVGMGLGVTLIPALAGMQSHDIGTRVALRPLVAPGASRIIGLVWRRRSPIAPTMESLAKFLKDKLPPGTLAVK